MKSLWDDNEVKQFKDDLLKTRAYSSRLLGKDDDLVLHGGGNTSVKIVEKNLFGQEEEILYVKGSGWDLATIKEAGFAPVRMKVLLNMAKLEHLSDTEMVKHQRAALTDPGAPNPSVEAILHAIIPFTFVDHTHADAVVTITNTNNGPNRIRDIYGDRLLVVPYVMPGFILAQEIYNRTRTLDWKSIEGMILLNHGVFTFHNDARICYEKMIEIVSEAEDYLNIRCIISKNGRKKKNPTSMEIARIRQRIIEVRGNAVSVRLNRSDEAVYFSNLPNVEDCATRGPITPDHVMRTKRIPVILKSDPQNDIGVYTKSYRHYFQEFGNTSLSQLDPAPRWAVWPGRGTLYFGTSLKEVKIISDICDHTMRSVQQAEQLGGWEPLPAKHIFKLEYWELEQAKIIRDGSAPYMQGRIALVTGGASGIGKACVERLVSNGACVAVLDKDPSIVKETKERKEILGIQCDVTENDSLSEAIERVVFHFGGLDMLISNAGIFPESHRIEDMDQGLWEKSLQVNLTSHQRLLNKTIKFLKVGIDPAIVIIGSKNVPAPGPGASAYSVAKAGLTQLARVAALECASEGIRVNVIHPNAVFDTGIWTDEKIESRAKHYGITVEEYKTKNLLKTEITSKDVAELVITMLGSPFSKVTGAQVAIDGGSDRII